MILSSTARQTLQLLVGVAINDNPDFFNGLVEEALEEFNGDESPEEVASELTKFVLNINWDSFPLIVSPLRDFSESVVYLPRR